MIGSRWLYPGLFALVACGRGEAAEGVPAGPSEATAAVKTATATTATTAATVPKAAQPKARPTEAVPEGMVRVPAGIFLMGAHPARGNPEEKPSHEAIVASFYLDKTEVTHGAYMKCVDAKACKLPYSNTQFCNIKLDDHDDHPVNCIDLRQADSYCSHVGKRLPTEREWEYAASGGSERRRYSWGNDAPTKLNGCYDHPGGTCPVASFPAGAFGLHDMTGNAWEWTASKFTPYPSRDKADPIELRGKYAYRGGSWSRRFAKWMGTGLRNRYEADKQSAAITVRCAKSIAPLACPNESEPKDGSCARISGEVTCEEGYGHNGSTCVLAGATTLATRPPGAVAPTNGPVGAKLSELGVPQAGPDAKAVTASISRSRTPQHDSDCRKNWPSTPASYLFKGGPNYPSRKPAVSGAGCVPRDMGWSWTSACCAN